jgi:predicted small secreted protein
MKLTKLPLLIALPVLAVVSLSGCGTVESAAKDDCTSIGWQVGSAGYEDCFRARVRERNLDYSLPPGDRPSPSLI